MLVSFRKSIVLALFFAVLLIMIGCSESEKKEVESSDKIADIKYKDWKSYSYNNLVLHYPQDYPLSDSIYSFATKYQTTIRNDCQFLRIQIPSDTVNIFLYNSIYQGKEMTGEIFPFVEGDRIHYWTGFEFGPTVMMYLIKDWSTYETKHEFIYHGILRVLDASGRNYHKITFDYIDSNKFIPLHQLAEDKKIDVNLELNRSGEAASFVDFIVYRYGIDALKALYESQMPFDSTVSGVFKMSVDSLESEWLDVIGKAIGKR